MVESDKQKVKKETTSKKHFDKKIIGLSFLGLAFLVFLITHYIIADFSLLNYFLLARALFFVIGLLLTIPFEFIPFVFFDNREYDKNENIDQLVEKMRYRAVLFNNISILVFTFSIGVIITTFYLLTDHNTKGSESENIAVRISVSVLLIFLVQMLFKLFKYLLRVAAFYNGKADSIEYSNVSKIPLDKVSDIFTPDKYDITDMEESTISSSFIEVLKAKLGIK